MVFSGEGKQPAFVVQHYCEPGAVPWHRHRRAQLEYVSEGALKVQTEQGVWITPPQRAVWILPNVSHTAYSSRPYRLCTLYIEPTLIELPAKCGVVAIDSFMRDLLLTASKFASEYDLGSTEDHLIHVLLGLLPKKILLPLYLPEPKDERLKDITKGLYSEPSDSHTLATLANAAGITKRTAERLFRSEMNMSFSEWRQQLRLITGLEKLANGKTVTDVAFDVGYSTVSAFITMFKNALGTTPARYFRQVSKIG
jgi:AraC-like DNA-binding protein